MDRLHQSVDIGRYTHWKAVPSRSTDREGDLRKRRMGIALKDQQDEKRSSRHEYPERYRKQTEENALDVTCLTPAEYQMIRK
ncbi:hypothetical protein NMY22_g5508 [Coprinellus aureogranulatus]|nr:hypothetical protein NMY22_g5508 [Coprinellus aureogranulatus]